MSAKVRSKSFAIAIARAWPPIPVSHDRMCCGGLPYYPVKSTRKFPTGDLKKKLVKKQIPCKWKPMKFHQKRSKNNMYIHFDQVRESKSFKKSSQKTWSWSSPQPQSVNLFGLFFEITSYHFFSTYPSTKSCNKYESTKYLPINTSLCRATY